MRLIEDWSAVAKRAWSVRLALLTGFFSALELLLAVFAGSLSAVMPPGVFAGLAIFTSIAAAVARVIPQRNMES